MSHGLMDNDRMAYAGQVPWHGLGEYLGEDLFTAEQAIIAANLDWEVELWPLYAHRPDCVSDDLGMLNANSFGVVRDDTQEVLGIVGKRYTPIQNTRIFSFFDYLVAEGTGIYETAGSLFNGRKVWLLAKLGELVIPHNGNEDRIKEYILLCNSHDGSSAFRCYFTPVRVVCNNTLSYSSRKCRNVVSIRHTSHAEEKIQEAHKLMEFTTEFYEEFGRQAEYLAGRMVKNKAEVKRYIEDVFEQKDEKLSPQLQRKRDNAFTDFEQEEVVWGPTWFSAYNGVTGSIDHSPVTEGRKETKLDSLWFGNLRDLKEEAFKEALVYSK